MINRNKHSAGVTIELAIGVALAVSVLFVILGLFNNNLKNMIVNTNLSNVFKNNDVKTAFTAFNKDYSNSQINVQIMGEQGLARLRKKANNLALTLIESPFNNTNVNANTIEYLSLAIEAIVGRGDICVYMKNDSDKFCNEDGIGGYAYLINPSDPSVLTIKKVDSSGASVSATVDLPLNAALGRAISSSAVPKDSSGRSTLSKNEKYSFVKNMTNNFQSHITIGASLIRMLNTFASTTDSSGSGGSGGSIGTFATTATTTVTSGGGSSDGGGGGYTVQALITDSIVLLGEIKAITQYAFDNYGGNPSIDPFDNKYIHAWANQLTSTINNATTKQSIASAISSSFDISSNVYEHGIFRLAYDRQPGRNTACQTLVQGLVDIAQKHHLNVADFGVTDAGTYYSVPSSTYYCRAPK